MTTDLLPKIISLMTACVNSEIDIDGDVWGNLLKFRAMYRGTSAMINVPIRLCEDLPDEILSEWVECEVKALLVAIALERWLKK